MFNLSFLFSGQPYEVIFVGFLSNFLKHQEMSGNSQTREINQLTR